MKQLVSLVAIAALAACSGAEEPAPDAVPDETAVVAEEPAAMDQGPAPGDYVAVYPDGSELAFTTNADGTWSGKAADGRTAAGTFESRDGKTCFVSDPPSEDDSCWGARVMNDDGTWTSTNDAGVTVTVRPAAAAGG